MQYKESLSHGLMFHHFKGGKHPDGQGAITAEKFSEILEFVGIERIVDAQTWTELAANNKLDGEVCITFDDALRCQHDIALPVLESYGIKAFWFIYSSVFEGQTSPLEIYRHYRNTQFEDVQDFYDAFYDYVVKSEYRISFQEKLVDFDAHSYLVDFPIYTDEDKKFRFVRDKILGQKNYITIMEQMINDSQMNLQELTDLLWMDNGCLIKLHNEGHVVGLHSYSHPTEMSSLTKEQQQAEYSKNYSHLKTILATQPYALSHPCNSYNRDTLDILNDLGITLGFRANMKAIEHCALEYPRQDHANIMNEMNNNESHHIYKKPA